MKKREEKNLGRMIVGKMMGEEKSRIGVENPEVAVSGLQPRPLLFLSFCPHHFA
jgi:hypothetical protein